MQRGQLSADHLACVTKIKDFPVLFVRKNGLMTW